MGAPVKTELASLSEGLRAAVDTADEGLLVRVSVLMFPQVLRQCKHLAAELTRKSLLPAMDIVVPLERELGGEALGALGELALVYSLVVLAIIMLMEAPCFLKVIRIMHNYIYLLESIEDYNKAGDSESDAIIENFSNCHISSH